MKRTAQFAGRSAVRWLALGALWLTGIGGSQGAGFGPDVVWLSQTPNHRPTNLLIGKFTPCAPERPDSLLMLVGNSTTGSARGDALVSVSTAQGAQPFRKWQEQLGLAGELAVCGQFNGQADQMADVAVFPRSLDPTGMGSVFVHLSDGGSFSTAQLWGTNLCYGGMIPLAGDVDGDGDDDLVVFTKEVTTAPGFGRAEVWVALAEPAAPGATEGGHFAVPQRWLSDFSPGAEVPLVGDFDGDTRADIASVVHPGSGEPGAGRVTVALSDFPRYAFVSPRPWTTILGDRSLNQVYATADFNRDGRCDVVAFQRGARPAQAARPVETGGIWGTDRPAPPGSSTDTSGGIWGSGRTAAPAPVQPDMSPAGDAIIAFSDGTKFGIPAPFHPAFCFGEEEPRVGDMNGDGYPDFVCCAVNTRATTPSARIVRVSWNPPDNWSNSMSVGQGVVATAPGDWSIRLGRLTPIQLNEDADDPYVIMVGFRSRIGTPGSSRAWWSGQISPASDIGNRQIVQVPAAQGVIVISNVVESTAEEVRAGAKPEFVGAVVILMEQDNSSAATIAARANAAVHRFEMDLQFEAERAAPDNLVPFLQGFDAAYGILLKHMEEGGSILNDNDDLLGGSYFLYLAVAPEAAAASWPREIEPRTRVEPITQRSVDINIEDFRNRDQLIFYGGGAYYIGGWQVIKH